MNKLYFGWDPGMTGGLSALNGDGFCKATPTPVIKGTKKGSKGVIDIRTVRDWMIDTTLNYMIPDLGTIVGYTPSNLEPRYKEAMRRGMGAITIEKVHSFKGQGIASSFSFGMGYGMLQGLCEGVGWGYQLVTPQAWKKLILAGTQKDKGAACQYVHKLFPDVDLKATPRCKTDHDGMADAICMAEFGRRMLS